MLDGHLHAVGLVDLRQVGQRRVVRRETVSSRNIVPDDRVPRAILLMVLHRGSVSIEIFGFAKQRGDFERAEGLHSKLGAKPESLPLVALHRMPGVPYVPKVTVAPPFVIVTFFIAFRIMW